MPFTLPELPYDHSALEPTIDARTMEIHHGKHHQAYVDNANKALEGTELADAIGAAFGGVDGLKTQVNDAGVKRFGSGWTWLVADGGSLSVTSTPNQDSPVLEGKTPILGIDVWEHAYYLNYQNRRPDYLAAWWDVVNWDEVAKRFEQAS